MVSAQSTRRRQDPIAKHILEGRSFWMSRDVFLGMAASAVGGLALGVLLTLIWL